MPKTITLGRGSRPLRRLRSSSRTTTRNGGRYNHRLCRRKSANKDQGASSRPPARCRPRIEPPRAGGLFLIALHLTALQKRGMTVQVLVRDNNVDQALRVLKKKMQREGVFREMKLRKHYEKPSEKKTRERAEAIRRARKLARKKLQREGLLPMKPRVNPGQGRGGPPRAPRF